MENNNLFEPQEPIWLRDHNYISDKIDQAIEFSKDGDIIIYPVDTLEELEELWLQFNQMTGEERRKSDDKCTELFGMNNQLYYEHLKPSFLKQNIKTYPVSEAGGSLEEYGDINYGNVDIENAIEWSKLSGYPIIYPTRSLEDLEELWENFLSYPKDIRDASETKSIEYFGVGNEIHYQHLKSKFLQQDTPIYESFIGDPFASLKVYARDDSIPAKNIAFQMLSLLVKKNENYTDSITRDMVDRVTGDYVASNQNLKYDVIPFEDLPFFTPEEMIDMGVNQANPEDNFYDCEPIPNVLTNVTEDSADWFDSYMNTCQGFGSYDPSKWVDNVRKIYSSMNKAEDKDPYKQALLNFGWPPEAEFTPENRVKATKRLKSVLSQRNGSTQFVDLRYMDADDIQEAAATVSEDNILYPVFIVLEEGKSLFSATIKKVTKSNFSHAAISFDPKMEEFYSYGIEGSVNGVRGGFIKENIKDKDPDRRMAVFAIFLKKNDFEKIKENIEFFIKNAAKTSYSYINLLLTNIFRIPVNMKKTMICSQFVDNLLKLTHIDISKKNSAYVTPEDFNKFAKENKKIYILFDDIVAKYKSSKISRLVNKLVHKADPIKEEYTLLKYGTPGIMMEIINSDGNISKLRGLSKYVESSTDRELHKIFDTMIAPCLEVECYLGEAKGFPIQVDNYGNLLIGGINKKSLAQEYRESHTILREYNKAGNTEGIKFELYRLWGINCKLEKILSTRRFRNMSEIERNQTDEMKLRASILNDFKYFLGLIMEDEPDYNFSKEFKKSEFCDDAIRVNKSTIQWTGKAIKGIIKSL